MKVCCYSWFPRSAVGTHTARGFTLLEMLLVIFLMALVASTGLMLTDGVEEQSKYDDTKRRMELIRKAIVGDPTRTVNSAPEIGGFAADMGRLPLCLAELLELGDEITPATDPRTFASPCDDTVSIAAWNVDATTGHASGWHGPYLQVLPERNGALRFRDGYGNQGATLVEDALNSGWVWQLYETDEDLTAVADDAAILRIQSLGLDGTQTYPPGLITDAVAANRPNPLVIGNDWQVQLPATVNVTFKNQSGGNLPPTSSNQKLLLRVYLSDLTTAIDADDGSNSYLDLTAESVLAGNSKTVNFTLNTTPQIAIGMRAYAVVCYEVPATGAPDDYVIFDGKCEPTDDVPNTGNIRAFAVTPRQNLNPNLDWIIP
ncbi:type II secretion system protein [Methylomonas rivi]|uniref:Prepilin-type N-terminal cleavage/methylation domain-containing protein n=1 Tax=Methylomonas rivi TaxID=2952226 RepID=A0ABT1UCS5_9GAMM|nr:prepilin-type N-terminal cleavage/methylation domain-containing protein [Methylomonas sp. WSC-6]MCQ8130896.1 prepilin-type N-terminal cleavage/methylation domain-containing protein [Methylomonas sp. WSC-6]